LEIAFQSFYSVICRFAGEMLRVAVRAIEAIFVLKPFSSQDICDSENNTAIAAFFIDHLDCYFC